MNLPNEVPHGLPVSDLTQAVNQLIRYVRSITPCSSASVAVETLSNGTTFRVKSGGNAASSSRTTLSALNQFQVTCVPDGEPGTGDWLIWMNGGTAQAMFGQITSVESEEFPYSIPQNQCAFISLVYHIGSNGSYVHRFDTHADCTVGSSPPRSTEATAYFPIAVVEADGTVLQGHLGAVYLAQPWNVVELNPEGDEEAGEEEEEEEEE